ncbi:hypothetical protein T07_9933 [Trichinella nelsoni]|uniref:Uncharacterized protein n=1 Tax=Trichinella nelsoni TaxID=6336 RepID=A0A0V0SCQ9_9BILA|nr:hypothetical protein T07_9933 [Trichinella nelsoni]
MKKQLNRKIILKVMRFSNKTILTRVGNLIAFDNLDSVNNVPLVTDGGTRTRNLRLRRPAPYPLGHIGFEILFPKILREM